MDLKKTDLKSATKFQKKSKIDIIYNLNKTFQLFYFHLL